MKQTKRFNLNNYELIFISDLKQEMKVKGSGPQQNNNTRKCFNTLHGDANGWLTA